MFNSASCTHVHYVSILVLLNYDSIIISMSLSSRQRVSHTPHGMKPVNLGDIWEDLSTGIHHIFSRQSMLKKRYMGLYTYPNDSSLCCNTNQRIGVTVEPVLSVTLKSGWYRSRQRVYIVCCHGIGRLPASTG